MDSGIKIEFIAGIFLAFLAILRYLQGYLIEYIVSPVKKWFKKEKLDAVTLTSGRTINNLLMELRIKTEADRAAIFLFHNGLHFNPRIINSSIWKFTCAYETCKAGVSYESANLQNLLVTNHLSMIQSLWGELEEGFTKYNCPDCQQNCKETRNIIIVVDTATVAFGSTRSIFEAQGIKKLIISPIIIQDDYVGFVSISYASNFSYGGQLVAMDHLQAPRGLKILCEYANRVGYFLGNRN